MSQNIIVRKSEERGHADHGWLNSYHTFSFASYSDSRFKGYRTLRVLNEDRVTGGKGFGLHPHSDFEIFSYVISGALEHKDSMNNTEVIKRGDVQFTSAGTGIYHSEYNHSKSEMVHFLQMWVKPNKTGLKPSYSTKHFSDEEKKGTLRLFLSPTGEQNSIVVNQDVKVYASILQPGTSIKHKFDEGRFVYVHVVQLDGKDLEVNGVHLKPGDGAFIEKEPELTFKAVGKDSTEFIVFDLA
eukprot:TRINITY_DN16769_c0_g1_i1.p1 TRINITY_DN16769_c0_g1~~TRINITY_DN16769_c0_g1_i1.p1  ORF type:complete len:283 (-),score=35.66 TRINITY_DN16769_c0_g1_i1:65-787(-)